jgi:hypothetical protein
MPVVFRYKGYRFFFYSNEGDPKEPLHIHVRKAEASAKIWLEPEPRVADAYGMSPGELHELLDVAVEHKDEIKRYWMSTSVIDAHAKAVRFDAEMMWVELTDGRTLGVPVAYFPRLVHASPAQRQKVVISGGGIGLHWDDLDEDISVPSLLLGIGDRTRGAA